MPWAVWGRFEGRSRAEGMPVTGGCRYWGTSLTDAGRDAGDAVPVPVEWGMPGDARAGPDMGLCWCGYGGVPIPLREGDCRCPSPVLGGGCWGRYRWGDAGVGIEGGTGMAVQVWRDAVVGLRSPVPQVQEIVFRNFYTAFLSVRVQRPGPGGSRRWMTCLRDLCLMPCPHTEEGSQDYFCLHRHQVGMSGWVWHLPPLGLTPLCPHPRMAPAPGVWCPCPTDPHGCKSPCVPLSPASPHGMMLPSGFFHLGWIGGFGRIPQKLPPVSASPCGYTPWPLPCRCCVMWTR